MIKLKSILSFKNILGLILIIFAGIFFIHTLYLEHD